MYIVKFTHTQKNLILAAEAQSLKAESFDEPNARAQSLASADWIKSFKSAQKSSSVMLGLKQPAKPKMMTKEQEVKQGTPHHPIPHFKSLHFAK